LGFDYTLSMRSTVLFAMLLVPSVGQAQWEIQESHSTASLRGIHALGNGVAWASGSGGTVLRTTDDGAHWQACAVPPNGEKLDFRGVQGFDAETAIVMSSGQGDLSRLYKTGDGCKTWALLFTNSDAEGFWDALIINQWGGDGFILGDPVDGAFVLYQSDDDGSTWRRVKATGLNADPQAGAFAASNSSVALSEINWFVIGTGGTVQPFIYREGTYPSFTRVPVPMAGGKASAGIFSVQGRGSLHLVAVGGDYLKADESTGASAFSGDGGRTWLPAATPPHGYRSSVAYFEKAKTWITVGPNGTDVSMDDGRNWRALRPGVGEAADADRNWNALSLPFVVGAHGRIGKLRADAFVQPGAAKP
jgi:photosystem II stability/assembly factor-like uncharacterized protein